MLCRAVTLALLFCSVPIFCPAAHSAPKPHLISFGKWAKVKWVAGPGSNNATELRVRPLYIDGRLREFVLNAPHEITERLFVVRQAFRINDNLPEENAAVTRWLWQRGGWTLVDRLTGHVRALNFTGFDPYYSNGEWYRDYYAYCSLSEDGKKSFAVVEELERHKPVIKQPLGEFEAASAPDSACAAPTWQRQPARVTFQSSSGQKLSFTLRGQIAGEITLGQDEEADDSK